MTNQSGDNKTLVTEAKELAAAAETTSTEALDQMITDYMDKYNSVMKVLAEQETSGILLKAFEEGTNSDL